ncbi:M16 family metallopeptidase [uncultured Algibacter sp.]|uniref:M16 family metallopeptidase n=1 Tax=uncultured Algibacter sp. TaxID=298659 RepID=UPI002615D9CF|nr:M16 family metallopeptidase [uncultured Algibacter sp.]
MIKNFFLVLIAVTFSVTATAQKLDLKAPLPLDTSIKKGVLPNGMTYYLYKTDVVKDAASYYIIQNVGSILENDKQLGLAHFLEHMAFNGTKAFPGKAFLNKLQKNGLVFGKDINAYTSFDETVYNINNMPTTPELSEVGLQILHDWANDLLLTEEEIDAERGVVKEEWRTRNSAYMRILNEKRNATFANSKYADRFPIGDMDIVENFKYKVLRDFYHDWYRTDLQAIVVIGDIDIDKLEDRIKAKFSPIPAVKNPPKRYTVEIEDHEDMKYVMAKDKEITSSGLTLNIRYKKPQDNQSIGYFRDVLLNGLVTDMLNTRFDALSNSTDSPFNTSFARYSSLVRNHDVFYLYVAPKPDKQQQALTLAMNELNRAVKFGFANSEIKTAITEVSNSYKDIVAEYSNRKHSEIINGIKSNYLENAHMTDIEQEYEIAKKLFKEFTQTDFLNKIQELYTQKNRVFTITGVEGEENLTEAQVLQTIKAAENNTDLKPYEEEKEDTRPLMSGVDLVPGKIVSETKNDALGFTTYTLSNGIKVHHKFVDKEKNEVSFEAVSKGGESLIPRDAIRSASMLAVLSRNSGLGVFSRDELKKKQAGKSTGNYFRIRDYNEYISGYASTDDVETLLQLTNLRFTKPRFTQEAFELRKESLVEFIKTSQNYLPYLVEGKIATELYGPDNPYKSHYRVSDLETLDLEKAKKAYSERFGNPADFDFFIVGDVTADALRPLLEKYYASMPTTDERETFKEIDDLNWLSKKYDKDIYLEMETPKSKVNFRLKKEIPYSLKNEFLMETLGGILTLRYTETLREDEGGTYGANTQAWFNKEPKAEANIWIRFDCNPELADKLVSVMHAEMKKISKGDIQQKDLDKTLESFLKKREDSKNSSSYDLDAIMHYVLDGYNMDAPENFEDIINNITKKDIQDLMAKLLEDNQTAEFVIKPKKD